MVLMNVSMYVCMSVTLRNAKINAYALACIYSINVLYLLPRGFYLELIYSINVLYLLPRGFYLELMMSEQKRQLARLRK